MKISRSTFVVVLAALALLATPLVSAPAAAASLVPSGSKGGGYFGTNPVAPIAEGQKVTLTAMFANKAKGKNVTFYRQSPAADPTGEFVAFAVKKANKNGNAYVDGYVVSGDQNWFAKVNASHETEVELLKPVPPNDNGVVNPISGSGKTVTARFDPATPGAATKLQIQRSPTTETSEVNSTNPLNPTDGALGPWVQIETGVQDAHGNTTFNLPSPYPYRVAHNYRALSVNTITPSVEFELAQVTPKASGLPALHFNANEGRAVDTRENYVEGEVSMTASTNLPECTAVGPTKHSIMKGRGNYSWTFNRKSFTLKLGSKINLCGMGSSKKWALISNDYDKTFMRSSLAGYVGSKLTNMPWTPKSKPVDLYVNGSYRGNYLLIERIAIQVPEKLSDPDPNKRVTARVNIPELKGGEKTCPVGGAKTPENQTTDPNHVNNVAPCVTGGYILEWDYRRRGEYNAYLGSDTGYVAVKDPENDRDRAGKLTTKGLSAQQKTYIGTHLNKVDGVIRSSGFKDPVTGWRRYIDEASAVDFYIAQEFMKATDGNMYSSVFMYKQRDSAAGAEDGKLFMGPLWDFDLSAGSRSPGKDGQGKIANPEFFYLKDNLGLKDAGQQSSSPTWFARLNSDPAFVAAVQARWNEIYDDFHPAEFIDNQKSIIATSAAQTYEIFGHSRRINPYQVIKADYDADVAYLRSWVVARTSWLNSSSGFN